MAEIKQFPLSSRKRTVKETLEEMLLEPNIARVIIVAEAEDGATMVMSSEMTVALGNWLLDRGKLILLADEE